MCTGTAILGRTKRKGRFALFAAAIVCAAIGGPQHVGYAQCNYEVTAIVQAPPICIPGIPPATLAHDMSAYGVVGRRHDCNVSGAHHAFFWSPGTGFITLPKPPGTFSMVASGISDDGLIVGWSIITDVGTRGFLYDMTTHPGEYTYLEPLHGVGNSSLSAINNSGIAVGSRSIGKPDQSPNPFNAVIWNTKTGEVIDLGVMKGPNSAAADGNEGSDAAGWAGNASHTIDARAWLWTDEEAIELGVLPDAVQAVARSLNSAHVVVGHSAESIFGPHRGFRWFMGSMTEFVAPKRFDRFAPAHVSNLDQVVGTLIIEDSPPVSRAGIWQNGTFDDLNVLVVDAPSGITIHHGSVVGDNGLILAQAVLNGRNVGVLLNPIDQPLTDLNHDCRTDVHDLLILLEQWGPVPLSTGGTPIADFNGDGVVDVLDLLILLDHWDR